VLERALAKDPAERYPTMGELAAALEVAAAGVSGVRLTRPPSSISSAPTVDASSRPAPEAMPTMDALETADVPPPPPPAPRERRLRRFVAKAGAVLATLGMAGALWLGTRPRVVPLEAEEGLAAGTANVEARAAFRSGLAFWRDGNNERAQAEWERATALDPGYGAAHLWLAADLAQEDLLKARRAFEGATAARHRLQGGNQALYTALVPCIQEEPPDRATCMRRLEDAAAANPEVTYLRAWLTWIRLDTVGPTPETLADMELALTLPPGFGRLLAGKGLTLAYLGRFDEAMAVLDRCPSGTACMEYQRAVMIQEGRCQALSGLGRRWVARDAQSMGAYQALAAAAQAGGQPEEAVHELVVQADLRAPRDVRPLQALLHRSAEAVLRGDFAEVRRVLEEASPVVAPRPDRHAHVLVGQVAIELARETGDMEEARRAADGLLRRLGSWLSDARADDVSISRELEPYLLDVLVETGGMTAAERAERLRRWEDAWRLRSMPAYHPYLWLQGRGGLVRDEPSAREALATLPPGGVPPLYALFYRPDEGLGRMYLLTGDPRRALPYLRRAAEGCSALEDAWTYVRASIPLGQALEATGDREGACRAYQRVVSRWGKATPRSVSAARARELSAKLGCGGEGRAP
jgi:serine/threonine-protein kinase